MSVRAVWIGCLRAVVLSLLGLGSCTLGARPAAAMGCHVPDRPVFDLVMPGELAIRLDGMSTIDQLPAHQVRPQPCPGELPEPSVRPLSAPLVTESPPTARVPDRVSRPPVLEPALEPPLRHPSRIDRPPRTTARIA